MASYDPTRRLFLQQASVATAASLISGSLVGAALPSSALAAAPVQASSPIRVSLNENPFGVSPRVTEAIGRALPQLNRYADDEVAEALVGQIAAYERVAPEQVVLGEVLGPLGLQLAAEAPGGEFIYSTPGYLALIDATTLAGGVAVAVPLNEAQENDLPALAQRISSKTRALYLINPHNPSGTVSDDAAFKRFLREASQQALVIVDEAYLEYTADFAQRTAVELVREGAHVAVFRTFAKIHGLAGLPFGYLVGPKALIGRLRQRGIGGAEAIGRLPLIAAAAALGDTAFVEHARTVQAAERAKWLDLLQELRLPHSRSAANFVFFDAGRPQAEVAQAFSQRGIAIGRGFPPLTHWVRISLGTPEQNTLVRKALREIVHG